jgi:hypothetical protein
VNKHAFGITFIRYTKSQNIGKSNNLKVFCEQENQRPDKDSQNQLGSPIPKRGEH